MSFIQIKIDFNKKRATIYDLKEKKELVQIPSLKKEILKAYLKTNRWEIEGIMLDGYPPYLELLKTFYPEEILCISPDWMKSILHKRKNTQGVQKAQRLVIEELSAAIDPELESVEGDFFDYFYQCKTKEEAYVFYNLWQIHAPLNSSCLYAIIRTIEYYKEPVFNYFSFKKAFAASK